MNHVDKYYWIINHPSIGFTEAQGVIELTPQTVNPVNNIVEEDVTLNTKYQWWVEFSKLSCTGDEYPTHFWELDCGGDTAEEAIHKLYELVLTHYGDYDYD